MAASERVLDSQLFFATCTLKGRFRLLRLPTCLTVHQVKPSPTIREVAARAGVSRTAVSMALRNHPRVSQETKKRISVIAAEMGYRPDPVVNSLMTRLRVSRRSRGKETIAYLTFWDGGPFGWKNNINESRYFNGALARAEQLGYTLEHFWAKEPGVSSARLSKILYTRAIRGVILSPLPGGPGSVSLDWDKFAVAALGTTVVLPRLHRATHDYFQGMTLALKTLRSRGIRRIGFANASIFDLRVGHGWLSAFLTFQFEISPRERIPPFLVKGWEQDRFAERLRTGELRKEDVQNRDGYLRWLERWRPDGVVSNTDHPFIFAREHGIKIAKDMAFAQLHRLRSNDPWAGIERRPEVIGAAATDLVVAQLLGNESGLPDAPRTITIEGVWGEGPSVPQAGSATRPQKNKATRRITKD